MSEITNIYKTGITVQQARIIHSGLLFLNVLSELCDIRMTLTADWSWEHKDTDTEEEKAYKTFTKFEHSIDTKTSYFEKLEEMQPLIEFIKTNKEMLKESGYKHDWSKYVTDDSDIQNSLKIILSSFQYEMQADSRESYISYFNKAFEYNFHKRSKNNALMIIAQYFEKELY